MSAYFIDSEFYEDGEIIDLLSIAIVANDNKQYYAVNSDFNFTRANKNKWLKENVLKHIDLEDKTNQRSKKQIKSDILKFIGDDKSPKFVADYCSYDWIVLCQIFGKMIDLPDNFPMYCNDLQMLKKIVGAKDSELPTLPNEHHALNDACQVREQWLFLEKRFQEKFKQKLVF